METVVTANKTGHERLSRECPVSPRSMTNDSVASGAMLESSRIAVKLNQNSYF
jgi:hypothetical protein